MAAQYQIRACRFNFVKLRWLVIQHDKGALSFNVRRSGTVGNGGAQFGGVFPLRVHAYGPGVSPAYNVHIPYCRGFILQ